MGGFVGGTGIAYPTSLTEIGLGIETTKGTLLSEPTYMFPVMAPAYKPDQVYIMDETLVGNMVQVQDSIQGMRYDGHGWNSYPYLDSFPVLVCAELGSPDTKGTAPTSTTLSSAANPGDTTLTTAGTVAAGKWITLGSGNSVETHRVLSVAGSYTLTLDPVTGPVIFAHATGAAVTGLTSHAFSVLNNANQGQPNSCSMWDYTGEEWRTLTACQLDELTIKGNSSGLVEYTCTWFCNAATPNASAPSTSYTTTETALPWSFNAYFNSAQCQTIQTWEFNFKRQVKPIPALTGTQSYLEYFASTQLATGKLTFVEQSGSPYLGDYENGTKQALDFTIFDPQGNALNIHTSKGLFTTGALDRNAGEWVTVPVDVQMLPTSTDATAGSTSPVKITVANAVTTAYL
jgi:hypothetical protein